MEVGFSASGWLLQYQLGVMQAIQRHELHKDPNFKVIGASGGAAVAAAGILDVDLTKLRDFMLRAVVDANLKIANKFKMREYLKSSIERCMHKNTYNHPAIQTGRLSVSITLLPSCRNQVVNSFSSNEEFVEAILASSTMTPLAGFPFQLNRTDNLNGQWVLDGGVTAMQPRFNERTITCTPLYCFEGDIKPSRYVPIYWAMFPPSVEEFRELFWLGVHDGETFLRQRGWNKMLVERPRGSMLMQRSKSDFKSKRAVIIPDECSDDIGILLSDYEHITDHETIKPVIPQQKVTAKSSSSIMQHKYDALLKNTNAQLQTKAAKRKLILLRTRKRHMFVHERMGREMPMGKSVINHVKDGLAVVTMSVCIKPMGLGIVYAELAGRAAVHAGRAVLAARESPRRKATKQREGLFSMRRWLPSDMIGTAAEAAKSTKNLVFTMTDPKVIVRGIPFIGKSFLSAEEHEDVEAKLAEHSTIYRWLASSS